MKINEKEICYIEYLCNMLPKILKDINKEYKENEYLYSSSSKARFERLRIEMIRIEMNKSLIKIKKAIYK